MEYGDSYRDESDGLLIIPDSDATLNAAFMIYDAIVLSIDETCPPAGQTQQE